MFLNNRISFLSLLIYLIPISMVLGIAVTEVLILIIFIFFIYHCVSNKNYFYFKSKYFKLFMVIYLFLVVNSIFSKDIILSLKVSLPYIRYGILSLAIWLVFEENKDFLKYFRYFLLLTFALLIFDGFIQYIFGHNIIGYSTQSLRLSSFFFDEWILGSFVQKFFPLLILILFYNDEIHKYLYPKLIFLVLTYLIVFLSGERAAFFLLSFYLIIVLGPLYFILNKINKIFYFFIPILLLLFFVFSPIKNRVFLINPEINPKTSISNFYKSHYDTYLKTSIKIFYDHKIIGSGIKTYRVLCKEYYDIDPVKSCSTHPHNYYVQVLAETGLIGIFILLTILLYLIINYIRLISRGRAYLKENYFDIIIISGLIVFLWPFATTGSLFNNFISIILFFNFGFLIKNINSKKPRNII